MGGDSTAVGASQLTNVDLLLVDDDEQWARVTGRLLESAHEAFNVDLVHSLSAGRSQFEATDPACVICDYQLGDGTGLDLLETVRETDVDRPFVLVTGRGDEAVASEAIGRGVTDYIPKDHDDTDATLLANRVANAVESARTRHQLDRERRGKAAALELLTSTTNVTDLSTEFCQVLVEDHDYAGAWIGGIEDGEIVPQTVEGCAAYLDAFTDSGVVTTVDDPVVMAAEREESVALSLTSIDSEANETDSESRAAVGDNWQQLARDHGFVTATGIPIRRDGIRIGVLGVYRTTQQSTLGEQQWKIPEEYAQILGYVHRTAELKRSLLADESVHLDIEITDTTAPIAELTEQLGTGVSATVPSTVGQDDGTTLYLTQLSGTTREAVEEAVEACKSVDLSEVSSDEDGIRCDLYSTVRTPEDVLAANGAGIERTVGVDGTTTISVSLSDYSSVGDVTAALRTAYNDVTVSRVWNYQERQPRIGSEEPLESLTGRQRNVLSHAYFDGYFEQPRGISATELAAKFNISRTTMTQHMRTAQRKLFGQLFDQ